MPADRKQIAIFDADNTLWDTNAVFTEAQKSILRSLKEAGTRVDPDQDFGRLREIDDLLIKHFGKREYKIEYLSLCLKRLFNGEPIENIGQLEKIIANSEPGEEALAKTASSKFGTLLTRIPDLLPDVLESLASIREAGRTIMILYSEGKEERLRSICGHYEMEKYFHEIIFGDKSDRDWFNVKQKAIKLFEAIWPNEKREPLLYVIGDLLERDIKPGNLIGAKTIYKPGGYKPGERPKSREDMPTVTVSSMKEVVALLWEG